MKNSHDAFKTTIQKKHEEIKTALGNLINAVGGIKTNTGKKEETVSKIVTKMINTCSILQEILMPPDRPKWIDSLRTT